MFNWISKIFKKKPEEKPVDRYSTLPPVTREKYRRMHNVNAPSSRYVSTTSTDNSTVHYQPVIVPYNTSNHSDCSTNNNDSHRSYSSSYSSCDNSSSSDSSSSSFD